jgi:hypothetical protein
MRLKLLALCLLGTAGITAAAPARADQDAVQLFRDIQSTPNEPVHDAVCFFCSAHIEGEAKGDVVVFFGDVELKGQVHRDVVDFFGSVSAADNSSIGGDLVNFFGSIHLGKNVTVGKDIVAMFGTVHATDTASNGGSRVIFSPWIFFGPLLIFVLVIYLIVHEIQVRRQRRFAMHYPMPPPPPPPHR